MREGNLEAPTRHPLDWKSADFYDEGAALQGTRARLRHLPRLPPVREPVHRVPDPVRPGGRLQHAGGGRRRQEGLLEGRRPVLPVRHLLHDQVPLRAAASLERGLPAPDAARQGDQVQEGRRLVPRQAALLHRRDGQAEHHSGGRADGERGEQERRFAGELLESTLGVHKDRELPEYASEQVSFERFSVEQIFASKRRQEHARQGRGLLDLLRQLQRARHGPRPARGPRAQRDSLRAGREGSLLRHAQARTGRFGFR